MNDVVITTGVFVATIVVSAIDAITRVDNNIARIDSVVGISNIGIPKVIPSVVFLMHVFLLLWLHISRNLTRE